MTFFGDVEFIDSTTQLERRPFTYENFIAITNNFSNDPRAPRLPGPDEKVFRGFTFSREDVLKALGDDSNPNPGTAIYLAFGYHKKDVDPDTEGLTIALAAYGADGKLIKDNERIFDFSEPCPCKCPRDIHQCLEEDVSQDEG